MSDFRDIMTSPLKVVVSFDEWKQRNPGVENFVPCPYCCGFGDLPSEYGAESCVVCDGLGDVNDLRSLYESDLEHDLRLIFAVYPHDKIPPRLKAFLERFHVIDHFLASPALSFDYVLRKLRGES